MNRLISANDNSYTRSMCYDAYGNGWVTGYTGTPSLPGNAPREIGGACPAGSGATPYATATNRLVGNTYDADGNQTVIGGNTVNYDAEGRVVSVVSGSTTLVSYQYDGDGRRVQKTAQSGTTNFVYDASGALMAEYLGAAISKEYVRFHSSYIPSNVDLVATKNALGNGAPCSPCFIISDLLGNVRMVADNAGHAASRHDYLPFGEEALADPNRPAAGGFGLADSVKQRFTGKERDTESLPSLDYFGARYYGSSLGRFSSPDPSRLSILPTNPQTWNRYSYVYNNPLVLRDDNGKCPTAIHNDIIDKSFPNLSPAQRQLLKNVSADQDGILNGGQSKELSFQHAMRAPYQSVADAQSRYNDFVKTNEDAANNLQMYFSDPDTEFTSLTPEALAAFGEALHAIEDSLSPAHSRFQVWDYNTYHVWQHHEAENQISPQQMQRAIDAARSAFNKTFRFFNFHAPDSWHPETNTVTGY